MIHTILPQEALLPQQPPPPTEWLPCCEGWVQVTTAADGTQTVQGVCSTDPAAYLKADYRPGTPYRP